MKSYLPALLNIIPGFGHLYLGGYRAGLFELAFFASAIYCALMLQTPAAFIFIAFVMMSSAYRMTYRLYVASPEVWRSPSNVKTPLEKTALNMINKLNPVWWIRVLNWPWLYFVTIGLVIAALAVETESSWVQIAKGFPAAIDMFNGLLNPNWSLLPDAIKYAKQTIDIAILGTLYGLIIAIPISVFSARNLMLNNRSTTLIYYSTRWLMAVLRATPIFLLGLIFVAWVGLGPFPGVLAITLFSAALMTKLLSEAIETVNNGPIEAATATGANLLQVILFSVFPQMLTTFIAVSLYCLEINIHSATVLGLIGAQGIGLPINEYLSSLAYGSASVFILVVIVITILTDYTSAYVRSRIK